MCLQIFCDLSGCFAKVARQLHRCVAREIAVVWIPWLLKLRLEIVWRAAHFGKRPQDGGM
jgi:hypothetical protein